MPDTITIYDPIVQLKAIELMKPVLTFLYDLFVQEDAPVGEEDAIFDMRRGTMPMAPFVHETAGGVLMGRNSYQTNRIHFPELAPERMVKKTDIAKRAFAEAVYGGMTPQERAIKLSAKDLQELKVSIQWRREWLVAQVLLYGKIDIIKYTGDGKMTTADEVVDYGFTNLFTAGTPWSGDTADIQADMGSLFDMVEAGLGTSEVLVMAPDVKAAIQSNEKFLQKLNLLHVSNGELKTEHRQHGVTYIGTSPDGQEMYSYGGTVTSETGTVIPLIPSGKIICGSRKMLRCTHGPVTQVEKNEDGEFRTYIAKEVPLKYSDTKTNTVKQRVTSRPMVYPINASGWAVGDVL